MKHLLSLCIPLTLTLSLAACNFRDEKVPLDTAQSIPITEADLNFANVKSKVIEPYCISCHSGAGGNNGGVNLESYASVLSQIQPVEDAVIISRTMPPSGALSQYAYDLLKAWIELGAPES